MTKLQIQQHMRQNKYGNSTWNFPTIQIRNKKNIEDVFRMYFNQNMEIKVGTLYVTEYQKGVHCIGVKVVEPYPASVENMVSY